MKVLVAGLLIGLSLLTGAVPTAHAQALSNIYGAGASYNQNGVPSIAGTGLYAHLVSPTLGTYAFTVIDVLPNTQKVFTISTNIGVGVTQKLFTVKSIPVFVPSSVDVSVTGSNTGWAWTTGGAVVVHVKGDWYVLPNIRLVKSSVTNGTGYQTVVGALMAWGR